MFKDPRKIPLELFGNVKDGGPIYQIPPKSKPGSTATKTDLVSGAVAEADDDPATTDADPDGDLWWQHALDPFVDGLLDEEVPPTETPGIAAGDLDVGDERPIPLSPPASGGSASSWEPIPVVPCTVPPGGMVVAVKQERKKTSKIPAPIGDELIPDWDRAPADANEFWSHMRQPRSSWEALASFERELRNSKSIPTTEDRPKIPGVNYWKEALLHAQHRTCPIPRVDHGDNTNIHVDETIYPAVTGPEPEAKAGEHTVGGGALHH